MRLCCLRKFFSKRFMKKKPQVDRETSGDDHNDNDDSNIPKFLAPNATHLRQAVPEMSYSSSDDEDFYDAPEDTVSTDTKSDDVREPDDAGEPEEDEDSVENETSEETIVNEGAIDYDAVYEQDSEQDLGSLESHGSVISHLLSQVRIGMDLTKVVLPTFILERRSLLEMYADFYAHPDEFIKITDFETPKERMVQTVKWYLSSFHAGRKSSVAKKPYNPILGETFKCHWNVPGQEEEGSPVSDGPVPWAHTNNLTFIAEQVSHHPPISAFYSEHPGKGISSQAYIWTKSKFLGISVCVHNVGQGIIRLSHHNEEYILNFPNGYGRSILTTPWIELGGHVDINCPQTGYNASIEFLTKPFYGGKKHKITCQIYEPQNKKPFVSLSGEWNGKIEAHWENGRHELFIDTQSMPITKKQVKPIVEQEEYESRSLWKEVTAALKFNKVEDATNAKSAVEQKQRDEAKSRLGKSEKWKNRAFHNEDQQWLYNTPLQTRSTEET